MRVNFYDTTFTVVPGETEDSRKIFNQLMKYLGSIGFYVGKDKEICKKFPSIAESCREGGFGDLRFKAKCHIKSCKIEFYQDVVYKNPHGGYYDFNKYEKMPYLIKKRFDWTKGKLLKYFEGLGYELKYNQNPYKGEAYIIEDYIRRWHHPQEAWFDLHEVDGAILENGNGVNRDGEQIANGEVLYFRDYNGYLNRGRAYHNINNMWWVLLQDGTVRNIASFNLFHLDVNEKRGRQQVDRTPKEYLERKKQLRLCTTKELENELKRRSRKWENEEE